MDINVKVTLDAAPAFMAVLQGLLSAVATQSTSSSAPATGNSSKSKLKNSDKVTEKAPEPIPAAAAEPVQETDDEIVDSLADNAAAEPSVTIEQIRALIPEKKALVGADRLKALLTKYGTQNVTNLPKPNYDAFYNELKNLAA